MRKFILMFVVILMVVSCTNNTLPKPKPYLKLQYPEITYSTFNSDCPYTFEFSDMAIISLKENCWATIKYPKLKATIHITYREVNNNLNEILNGEQADLKILSQTIDKIIELTAQ